MRILLLGADGFIGRHIAYRLRAEGHEVIASARRTARLSRMGFEVLPCDLTARAAAKAGFWAPHLEHVEAVINAAGLLTGTPEAFEAVHQSAPNAIYAAAPEGCQILLLSAIGIDDSQTRFARFRRDGERLAEAHDALILRAGLVLGETSYGGSSLLRALAAIPLVGPYVGKGDQIFNPIHADDLAKVMIDLLHARATGTYEIGGPEHIAQIEMIDAYRQWLGLPQVRRIGLPMPLARIMGRIGDMMHLGPISRTAVEQLAHGAEADSRQLYDTLPRPPRGFSSFAKDRPAGSQDLWHARLYLMRPVLRLALAMMWLVSALIGLFMPSGAFLPLVETSLPDGVLIMMARLGGLADLAIGAAVLRGWRPRRMAAVQAAMIAVYTAAFTFLGPALWLLPMGGLLKNIPLLAMVAVLYILEDER